jgi:hypothetical protein
LFLPGQAGSYRQVRSFGTASAKLERQQSESTENAIDWFTVDFGDEWSGLSGVILQRQTAFAARCIDRILTLYEHLPSDQRPQAVSLVGHSMGGVVARAVAALPSVLARRAVGTVLALHSPLAPAALPHDSVTQFYASIDESWCNGANAHALARVAVLSLGGGLRDTLVRSDLSAVPQRPCAHNVSYATVLPSIEGIQRSADHQCGVWCLEVAERVALAFRQLTPLLDTPDESTTRLAVLKQHLGAPFRAMLRGGADASTSTGSGSGVIASAPATLKSNDLTTVKASGGNWSHWALVTTSPVARFVGRALPLPLTARDGVVLTTAPRLSLVPSGSEVRARGATVGATLVVEAQLTPNASPAQFSLWRQLSFAVTTHVARFDIDGVPRGVALVARAELGAKCSPRFLPRAIWCNDRCDDADAPLVEDYFVGLDESSASAVRFFGSSERLSLLVVADAECVERVALHVDWMATVGHLLRIHWQSLYSLAVVVALANASLGLLLGGDRRLTRLLVGGALLGATALLRASLEQLGVAAVALGTEMVVHQIVNRLVQPLLRIVGWLLHLVARRDWVLLGAVALVGYFDSAAALVFGLATLVRARREATASREFVTHILTLGVLVLPILATSTMVRIHAFTEHIAQSASGATHRGVVAMLLPQFVVWPCLVDLPQQPAAAARALLCVAGVALATLVLVRQATLAELLDGTIAWAVVGTLLHAVVLVLSQREKAKSQ